MKTARKIFRLPNGLTALTLCLQIAYEKEIVYSAELAEGSEETAQPDEFAKSVFLEFAEYFLCRRKRFTFAYCFEGTPFQEKVWHALEQIPYGETASYAEIAAKAGNPKAYRAAANACHRNPLALCVPCHRVIAKDGSLGGYAYGKELKTALLNLEKQGKEI